MEIKNKVLEYGGVKIPYILHIKKVKNLSLRISEQGELIITCNAFMPTSKIESFAREKVEWILKKQQKQRKKIHRCYEDCLTQTKFFLYDQELTIVRIQSNQNSVRYDEANLYIYYIKEEDMNKTMIKFIRQKCEKDFEEAVKYYYEKMKEHRFLYPTIKYRAMKSRWGSCVPLKNQICLNMRMLHYPKEFMEYVVVHELAHFVEPNHSTSFYRVIEYVMPDYRQRKKLMEQ